MEKQLSEFTARKLRNEFPIERPDRVLTLLVGDQACAAEKTWITQLKELWELGDQDILCHGFAADREAYIDVDLGSYHMREVMDLDMKNTVRHVPFARVDVDFHAAYDITRLSSRRNWDQEDINAVNETMRGLADRFAERCPAEQVICAIVCADDPLADKASDLLSLMTKWYQGTGNSELVSLRTILFILLPDRASMNVEKAERAFGLTEKLQARRTDRIFNPNYLGAPDKAYALEFDRSMDTFLMDAPEVSVRVLADAAYLLTPTAKRGGSMFLAAFDDIPSVYKHRLVLQMISCLNQLKSADSKDAMVVRNDVLDDLQRIVREEELHADYGRWMGHSCILRCRPHPGMSEEEVYGTWLRDMTEQWCRAFEEQALPEDRLRALLASYPDQELAEHKVRLTGHVMQPNRKTSRGKLPARADNWRNCLNQAIGTTYGSYLQEAHERRLNSLVQRMLTLVNERINNIGTAVDQSKSNMLAELRGIERNMIRKSGYTPAEMDQSERVRFTQILQTMDRGALRDYGNLFELAQALVKRTVGAELKAQAAPRLCCAHNYMLDVRSRLQHCCQLERGSRSGQVLYLLKMSEDVGDMNLNRISFFSHCNTYCRRDA